MHIKQFKIPVGFGFVCGQVFGQPDDENANTTKAIVSIHGYLDNSNSFRPVAKHITETNKNYYIIAIDLPGMVSRLQITRDTN